MPQGKQSLALQLPRCSLYVPLAHLLQNSQSGEFGPFSRFVPVAKNDGKYVLVLAGEYEDLKKQKKVAKQKFLDDADARPDALKLVPAIADRRWSQRSDSDAR